MRWWIGGLVLAFGTIALSRCSTPANDGTPDADAGNPCPIEIPDAAQFSCAPVPVDAATCVGPPKQCVSCDPSLAYPSGCSVQLPVKTTFCGPLTCTCGVYGDAWNCPL